MLSWFAHGSGISIMKACASERPLSAISSKVLSSLAVSLPDGSITGSVEARSSPNSSERSSGSRARIQFSLPCRVLISPLCMR